MKKINLYVLLFLLIISPLIIFSTEIETGTITGKVLDKTTKQPLPGANIIIVGTNAGTSTNENGFFILKNLDENVYKLRITFLGYNVHIETDVRVIRNKTTNVKDIELSESSITEDSVTVVAGYFRNEEVAPVSNYSYSREEIRRNPGAAGDIFRAIETLPGVASSGGGEFSAFSVRGGSPRENIVIIDNIPFDKVSHFDGGTEEQEAQGGRFSIFASGLIDEANFQAGGFSAKYGGKNSSFVDLKIKEGNKETPTINGTYDLIGWEINYDGPSYLAHNTSVLFSARHLDFQNVLKMTDQKDVGNPSFSDYILKTTTDIDTQNKISFLGLYAPEKFVRNVNHIYARKNNLFETQLQDVTETKSLYGINWRSLTSTSSYLQNTLYFKKTHSDFFGGRAYTDAYNGTIPTQENVRTRNHIFDMKNTDEQLGYKSELTSTFENAGTLTSGVEFNRVSFNYNFEQNGLDTLYYFDRDDYRANPAQYYIIRDPQFVNTHYSDNKSNAAAFSEFNFMPLEKLNINSGFRYEWNEFNKKSYFSPRLSARFQWSDVTTLNFAAGVYYQAPELRIIAQHKNNGVLNNERSTHFIFGITNYISEDVKLTAEIYYKSLDDIIVRPDRATYRRTNAGDGYARGIDIGMVKKFIDKWYGQINYSYSASKRNDHNGEGEYNSDFSQPHNFNILLGYELNSEWSFATKWKFATGRPKDSFITHSNVHNDINFLRYAKEITRNNAERLSDFHSWNIRIDYRKQLGRFALVTFLDILNMYNRLNVTEERFIERNGEIESQGFRIIPTMGVKLEM
jgi:hypothetical protein